MKNVLKKLSGSKRTDRREELEQEAADRIKEVGRQAPPEAASTTAWVHPEPSSPAPPVTTPHSDERRLTVQERLAARQLQN